MLVCVRPRHGTSATTDGREPSAALPLVGHLAEGLKLTTDRDQATHREGVYIKRRELGRVRNAENIRIKIFLYYTRYSCVRRRRKWHTVAWTTWTWLEQPRLSLTSSYAVHAPSATSLRLRRVGDRCIARGCAGSHHSRDGRVGQSSGQSSGRGISRHARCGVGLA